MRISASTDETAVGKMGFSEPYGVRLELSVLSKMAEGGLAFHRRLLELSTASTATVREIQCTSNLLIRGRNP